MTNLLITGCKGRMGQALLRAAESQKVPVAAAIDMGDDFPSALAKSDTVIDFTSHHFADELLSECLKQNKRLVIGTTGHTNEQLAAILAQLDLEASRGDQCVHIVRGLAEIRRQTTRIQQPPRATPHRPQS